MYQKCKPNSEPPRFGPKISWPVAPHQHLYRVIALWPIAIGLLATSLIVNFTSSGNSTPLFYLPVLNPLDLAQIAMFTILFVWLYRIRFGSDPQIMYTYSFVAWAVSVVAFIAFNASIARAIHHLGGVPFTGSALYNSELLQTIYAVLWGILALVLMFLASQRRWRGIWIGGSSILALTVLKLFFVDLANTGTLARIVSFISVGLLMIVVAYFAPPPPGEEEEEGEKVEVQAEVEERGIGETSLR